MLVWRIQFWVLGIRVLKFSVLGLRSGLSSTTLGLKGFGFEIHLGVQVLGWMRGLCLDVNVTVIYSLLGIRVMVIWFQHTLRSFSLLLFSTLGPGQEKRETSKLIPKPSAVYSKHAAMALTLRLRGLVYHGLG